MININEYLLGKKNPKLDTKEDPQFGCGIKDIAEWVKSFGIDEINDGPSTKGEKLYYFVHKTGVSISVIENNWYEILIRPSKHKYMTLSEITVDGNVTLISFLEAITIAKGIMLASTNDEIFDIMDDWENYIKNNLDDNCR